MPRKKTTHRRTRTSKDRNEGGVKKTTHEAIEGVKGGVSNVVDGIKKAFD